MMRRNNKRKTKSEGLISLHIHIRTVTQYGITVHIINTSNGVVE